MFRIITMNLNGIRSAACKGFFEWLAKQNADVVCLQETKAHMTQLVGDLFRPAGYYCYFFDAIKKGYSGVGLYSKKEPLDVVMGLGFPTADTEGRYLQAHFESFNIASLYMPSGSSGEERQNIKFDFMDQFFPILKSLKSKTCFICGDFNIVHRQIDIKNWQANQKNSGCLPEERAWLDRVFTELGWVDAFRVVNQAKDQYTWWSHRGRAWENNVGWRIDYHVITPDLSDKVHRAEIYREQKFSDHAPLIIDYHPTAPPLAD